jgi:hypothetical protein
MFNILKNYIIDLINLIGNWFHTVVPIVVKPTPGNTKVTLFDVIKAYTITLTSYYPLGSTQINACIPSIDEATMQLVADLITTNATSNGLSVPYLAACIKQESAFSPGTYNHNLNKSNPVVAFSHTDFGLCQFSGTYLPSKPGMEGLTAAEMTAKAFDPNWAVPEMAAVMKGNMAAAELALTTDSVLAANTKILNTTTLSDVEWNATLWYNTGIQGGTLAVKTMNTVKLAHPGHVGTWYALFVKALNG